MSSTPVKKSSSPESLGDREYLPYDDANQSLRQIERYPRSFTRSPSQPLIQRPLTLSEITGPIELERRFEVGNGDFAHAGPNNARALGQLISVSGRVTDEDGAPVAGAVIEIWQANAAGKYVHQLDRHAAPIDPNFKGEGRFLTNAEGCYEF